jgi:hypothetical protein
MDETGKMARRVAEQHATDSSLCGIRATSAAGNSLMAVNTRNNLSGFKWFSWARWLQDWKMAI